MENKIYFDEPVGIEVRALEDGTSETFITGYAAVFDKWSSTLTMRSGNKVIPFIEKIDRRAFDGCDMNNLICSVNHDIKGKTIGKRSKSTLDVEIDEKGLKYRVKVPNTSLGRDVIEDVRNGNLEGSSFMFVEDNNMKVVWDTTTNPVQRTILNFSKVMELGPVTIPAYPDTTAALRSYEEATAPAPKNYDNLKRKIDIFKLTGK